MFTTYTVYRLLAARVAPIGDGPHALSAPAFSCDRSRPVTRTQEVTK